MVNGKNIECFPPEIKNKTRMFTITISQHFTGDIVSAIGNEKEIIICKNIVSCTLEFKVLYTLHTYKT